MALLQRRKRTRGWRRVLIGKHDGPAALKPCTYVEHEKFSLHVGIISVRTTRQGECLDPWAWTPGSIPAMAGALAGTCWTTDEPGEAEEVFAEGTAEVEMGPMEELLGLLGAVVVAVADDS